MSMRTLAILLIFPFLLSASPVMDCHMESKADPAQGHNDELHSECHRSTESKTSPDSKIAKKTKENHSDHKSDSKKETHHCDTCHSFCCHAFVTEVKEFSGPQNNHFIKMSANWMYPSIDIKNISFQNFRPPILYS